MRTNPDIGKNLWFLILFFCVGLAMAFIAANLLGVDMKGWQ